MILNFIRKFSPKPSADSPRKTPGTHPSFTLKGGPNTDLVDALGSIENKQGNRLGLMERERRVPDDFNTMGASEIESLFNENK